MNAVLKLVSFAKKSSVKEFTSSQFESRADQSIAAAVRELRQPKIILAYGLLFIVAFSGFSFALR